MTRRATIVVTQASLERAQHDLRAASKDLAAGDDVAAFAAVVAALTRLLGTAGVAQHVEVSDERAA